MLCNKDFLVGCHINSWSWRLLMLTQTSNKHSLRLEYFLFQFKRGVSLFGASTLSVLKKTHSRVVLDTSKATNDQNSQNTRFKLLCVSIHLTIIFQSVFFDWYIYIYLFHSRVLKRSFLSMTNGTMIWRKTLKDLWGTKISKKINRNPLAKKWITWGFYGALSTKTKIPRKIGKQIPTLKGPCMKSSAVVRNLARQERLRKWS